VVVVSGAVVASCADDDEVQQLHKLVGAAWEKNVTAAAVAVDAAVAPSHPGAAAAASNDAVAGQEEEEEEEVGDADDIVGQSAVDSKGGDLDQRRCTLPNNVVAVEVVGVRQRVATIRSVAIFCPEDDDGPSLDPAAVDSAGHFPRLGSPFLLSFSSRTRTSSMFPLFRR